MLHEYFTLIDWLVVFGYLGLTTWVGHKMAGKQSSIKDFFLGGRSLPWQAVSGSIIATEISGVTFIGVPGMVFALTGNFTYFQWAIGSVLARIIVGHFFVKVYYEQEIYSPYDYMENRIGRGVKRLATVIFSIGSILSQSVRVLVAALALDVVTPWSFAACICVIGVFAIGWTLMGGMRTVIWTDVMQFALFTIGGSLALFWIFCSLKGGTSEFFSVGNKWEKFSLIDIAMDPSLQFTLWVALFAVPFQNLAAFGVDQLNAQRMFCCRSAADARKAIIWSSVGQALTLLMLMVGAALFVYYTSQGVTPVEAGRFAQNNDYVFPAWITTTLPVGLRGLILAGIFAAAISSLDSILAALSQTTLALFVKSDQERTPEEHRKLVRTSRILVICWGIGLSAFAILLDSMRGNINMVSLAFGMAAYTVGPMLGLFLAALLFPRSTTAGLTVGFILSFLLTLYVRTDLQTILVKNKKVTFEEVASWGAHKAEAEEVDIVDLDSASELNGSIWKKVQLRGKVTGIEEGQGNSLENWPLVAFENSEARVFVGRSSKKDYEVDLEALRKKLVGKTVVFLSSVFPNSDKPSAILTLDDETNAPKLTVLYDESAERSATEMKPEELTADKLVGKTKLKAKINSAWMWPITCILTIVCGILGGVIAGRGKGATAES